MTFEFLVPCVVYVVSASGGQPCPTHHSCHNLSYYLSKPVNYVTFDTELLFLEGHHQLDSETAVKLQGEGSLRLIGGGQWMAGPEETVMQSTVVIHCSKAGGGLAFQDFSSVTIRGLTFIGCGAYFSSQKKLVDFGLFRAGILLTNINSLTLFHVSVQESVGYGLAAIDCKQIDVTSSSFAYSNLKSYPQSNHYQEGGNVCIFYVSSIQATLLLSNSNFTKGQGLVSGGGGVLVVARDHSYSSVTMKGLVLYGNTALRGAGLAIFMEQGSSIVTITDTIVKNGYGIDHLTINEIQNLGQGGGIYIYIGPRVTKSVIIMDRMKFTNNTANKGGVIYVTCGSAMSFQLQNVILSQLNHTSTSKGEAIFLKLKKCLLTNSFIRNISISTGSAFSYGIVLVGPEQTKTQFSVFDSIFSNNNMLTALMIFSHKSTSHYNISNSVFYNNSNGTSVISFIGDVTAYLEDNLISNNKMTAITASNAVMVFLGENVIHNNSNTDGAGIYMTWVSRILLGAGSKLVFQDNTVAKIGGAILVQSSPLAPVLEHLCSIAPRNAYSLSKPQLIFSGNQALEGGSDVYNGKLMGCDILTMRGYRNVSRQGRSNETSYYFDFKALSEYINFKFINSSKLSSMSSNPIMVCFCDNTSQPDCSNRSRPHINMYPGQEVFLTIATVGYYGGTSFGTVLINVTQCSDITKE